MIVKDFKSFEGFRMKMHFVEYGVPNLVVFYNPKHTCFLDALDDNFLFEV